MTAARKANNAKKQAPAMAKNLIKGNPEILKTIAAIKNLEVEAKTVRDKISDHKLAIREMTNWKIRAITQYLREDKLSPEAYAELVTNLEDIRRVTGKQLNLELVHDARVATTGKRLDIVKKDARDEVENSDNAAVANA